MMLDMDILLGKKRWHSYIQQDKSSSKSSHRFHKLVMEFLLLDIDILQEFPNRNITNKQTFWIIVNILLIVFFHPPVYK